MARKVRINELPFVKTVTDSIRGSSCSGGFVYITIAVNGSNSNTTFFNMKAPVTQVSIKEQVDFSLTKSLKSDVLVATFGDQPVGITIGGAVILNPKPTTSNIVNFYSRNKFSANRNTRFDIGLAWANQAASYRCILLGLELEASSAEVASSGMSTYKMTFVGVSRSQSSRSLAGV